ncbi:hypothetical protein H0H87_010913 [Tephrocybe sp. NHM501043]|nr:hypothetical protein H0H87_010913 [Tephrocybe sp. NHM501043]
MLVLLAALLVFVSFLIPLLRIILRQLLSPLRRLPGPPSPSLFSGNLAELHDQENTPLLRDWEAAYGPTYVYSGFLSGPRLITTDPVALSHILSNAYHYPKPDFVRESLASMGAGHDGVLTAEGETHRRQRKILLPAFSKSHLDSLRVVFSDKAQRLRDLWLSQVDGEEEPPRIDILAPLARATLDVIGEAGFGYQFNALSELQDELAAAFALIFATSRKFRMLTILQAWFPVLRRFRHNGAATARAHDTMYRIARALISQKRAEVLNESSPTRPRDILSLLIRSNLSSAPTAQMSTPEIHSQISTFIAAGHETVASALTWCLYALAAAPATQATLRDALRACEGDIEHITYLDHVVRESLRLHPPVTSTMRVCARPGGDVLPLSVPLRIQALDGKEGKYAVRLNEGDILTIPISAVNRCERVWGSDAEVFRIKTFLAVLIEDLEFSIDEGVVIEKRIK